MSAPQHHSPTEHHQPETIDLTVDSDSSPAVPVEIPPPRFHLPRSRSVQTRRRGSVQGRGHPTPPPPGFSEVIDLISDSEDDQSNHRSTSLRPSSNQNATGSSSRLAAERQDPDFQVVGARVLHPRFPRSSRSRASRDPVPLGGQRQAENPASSSRGYFGGALRDMFNFVGNGQLNSLTPAAQTASITRHGPSESSFTGFLRSGIGQHLPGFGFIRGPTIPEELEIIGDESFTNDPPPMPHFNYETPGFAMFVDQQPVSPEYTAPSEARPGFSRKADDDDIIVCPRCGDELGVGSEPSKQQVWVVKQCGHVYCGACARQRTAPSRSRKGTGRKNADSAGSGWKTCVVDKCKKSVQSEKAMIQVYL
ncbi:MAG: hypothetical protein Q9227_009448 [Pyrenula ochraceoflavens]